MTVKVRIDLTFPTEDDYFKFMGAFMNLIDIDLEHIPFKCRTKRIEED